MTTFPDEQSRDRAQAAAFRRLVQHLQDHPEAQNIDLMILADFCRNCLSRWLREAAEADGVTMSDTSARELVYGMPYAAWKATQPDATPAQLAAYAARKKADTP
jgi:hypothetical protein